MKNFWTIFLLSATTTIVRITCNGKQTCGARPLFPKPSPFRIIGGREALPGESPWQVMIRYSANHGNGQCGGSIIDKWWILTAAHCFPSQFTGYSVVTGITNLNDDTLVKQKGHIQVHKVEKVIQKSNYIITGGYSDDIALLKLATPIVFDNYSQPVCVANEGDNFHRRVCTASGWGYVNVNTEAESRILKTVNLPIIPLKYCQKIYNDVDPQVFTKSLCTLYRAGGRDTCVKDSGGPLVCQRRNGGYVQVGVISWGETCGGKKSPAVYTKVSEYVSWIRNVTRLDA